MNAGRDTVPGVRHTVIETEDDEVVTPYTSAFLSGPAVTNVTPQDVVQALDDAPSFSVDCGLRLPVIGG
jgi:hypothetical protein